MLLPDVNVLVYAHREEMPDHGATLSWLRQVAEGEPPFGVSELVLSRFLRVVTNRRIFREPTSMSDATAFVEALVNRPNAHLLRPGPRNLGIFLGLCAGGCQGADVADAYHAALAIEHDCTWVTTDSGFGRFPGLSWMHPLRGLVLSSAPR